MAEKSKLWYLENFNLFKGLNSEKLDRLSKISKMKDFEKNQPVYFAQEPSSSIFFLKKGRVKLTRTSNDGKEMILGLVNPGEVFGEMSFLDEEERTDFSIAMEPALICAINKDEFKKFISENDELNLRITKLIGLRIKKYTERIEELVFKDAAQRIISFLIRLANDNGKQLSNDIFVKPFLKHQDIADLTACSRQTVNSVLTDLREKKIIDFDRRKLIIHDKESLLKLMG